MPSLEALSLTERISTLQRPLEVQIIPNLGGNSQLEGTGFNLFLELKRLYKNYNQNVTEGESSEGAWALSVGELEVNVRTFIIEYIQSSTVLPHKNRIEEVNGVNRMVGNNGVPVVEGITDQERYGGVMEASVKVEDFISAKAPDRTAVINSPLGHSGFFKQDGSGITYQNNQTMVFWTNEKGELRGLTLVTDLNESQSKQLSLSLGVSEASLTGQTQLERVSNIVRNPALFSYSQALKNPAEYVLDKIIAIRGSSNIKLVQDDGTVEIRSVEQTRRDIQRASQLLSFNEAVEAYITELKNNLLKKINDLNHPIIQSEIARKIEETILNITIDHLQKTPNIYYKVSSQNSQTSALVYQDKFMMAAAFLRTRSGCAGGGSNLSLRGISLGSGVFSSSFLSSESTGGICNKCGASNNDNHYHCPECPAKYADETNKSPEARTKQCSCGFKFGC